MYCHLFMMFEKLKSRLLGGLAGRKLLSQLMLPDLLCEFKAISVHTTQKISYFQKYTAFINMSDTPNSFTA